MESITIRNARLEDSATIKRIVRAAGLDPMSLHWPNFLVADRAGRIIGIGQVKPYPGARELGSLAVLKAYRGRGVGSMIILALIERETGDLYLLCREALEVYYEPFGFRRAGWRELRGMVRRKYVFVQLFRLLFRVNVIAMRRPARGSA